MADLLLDIVNYLIAQDVVTGDGVDIFRDIMPDEPGNCSSLHEYLGDIAFINNMTNRSIQVRHRNTDYVIGKAKIKSIYDVLYQPESEIRIVDFTATRWGIVKARNYPYKLNNDERDRVIFIFNMGIVTIGD